MGIGKGGQLVFGKGKINSIGKLEWERTKSGKLDCSGSRTNEIVSAVALYLLKQIERREDPLKPYEVKEFPKVGKLVFIKKGYDFDIKPEVKKKRRSKS